VSAILERYRQVLERSSIQVPAGSAEPQAGAGEAEDQPGGPGRFESIDEGNIGAVLIHSRILNCEVWLVPDAEALDAIADEIGDRPAFLFSEVEHLRGKSGEELRAIAATKRVFGPGARVVQ
jgi:hypothetical protein